MARLSYSIHPADALIKLTANMVTANEYTSSGYSVRNSLTLSEQASTLKGKEFANKGNKLFYFQNRPLFPKGLICQKANRKSSKCVSFVLMTDNLTDRLHSAVGSASNCRFMGGTLKSQPAT